MFSLLLLPRFCPLLFTHHLHALLLPQALGSLLFADALGALLFFQALGVLVGQEALDKLADFIDVEPVAAEAELLHLFVLLILCREGDLKSEPLWVVGSEHKVLIEPELDVREVAEVENIESIACFFWWGA